MNLALLARRFIFLTVVAVLLFDLYLISFGSPGDSISIQTWKAAGPHASIAFAFGYLMGHIFGRIDK